MKKMSNGFKYSRVLSIYTKLMDGEVINKTAEAEYFGVNLRTIQRDIDDLRMFFEDKAAEGELRRELVYSRESGGYQLVKKWQDFITDNFYVCTNEILSGLGEMYIADERFKANIDKHGDGTAQFMCDSIKAYCE